MPVIEAVNNDNFIIRYDTDKLIGAVVYKGRLTSEITAAVYQWMAEATKNNQAETPPPYGWIFDFRQVTDYDADNFATARSKSISFRLEHNGRANVIPTALLVNSIEQEVMVKISMQLAKQGKNPRIRLLRSDEEANKFFAEWHADHPKVESAESTAQVAASETPTEPKPAEMSAAPK